MNITLLVNTFCFIMVSILLLGIYLQKRGNAHTAERFSYVLFAILFFLLTNCLCELASENQKAVFLNYALNLIDFWAVDLIILAFTLYVSSLLGKQKNKKTRYQIWLIMGTCFFRMLLALILTLSGDLFTIENGNYVEQSLSFIPYVLSIIIMIELLVLIIRNRSSFSSLTFTVMLLYLLLPIIPIAVELFTEQYVLTSMSTTASITMVYVLIQTNLIEEAKLREQLLEDVSTTDILTKLNNRRSYYAQIQKLEPDKNVGILFCDLNGLKTVNDHFGHKAGDDLIQSFANLLTESFRKDEVFRISGDEFVVIIPAISDDDFCRRLNAFRAKVVKKNEIAAVGCSYGTGSCFEHLVSEAEQKMYEDKEQYYSKHGIIRSTKR